MIARKTLKQIESRLFKGKIMLLLGPRQVGKSTLLEEVMHRYSGDFLFLNGDERDVREHLSHTTSSALRTLIGNKKLVIIDEAQRIPDIGLTLKLIVDNIKGVQVIASGSSAFELANKINEPLTGRKYEFFLYPISFGEMVDHTSLLEEKRLLEHRMIFGYYPEVISKPGEEKELLSLITGSYLYKDLFEWEQIKKPALLEKILQALALQLGSEVFYTELGRLVGTDNETVERYISLLERAFVIFRVNALSRNLRNEIKKTRKVYFWDNGVRNAIIRNFNPLAIRQDVGALWENFLIMERIKRNHYAGHLENHWFWRTHAQQEVDYVEESDGQMRAFEFKWNGTRKTRFPKTFKDAYPEASTMIVSQENYTEFIYTTDERSISTD